MPSYRYRAMTASGTMVRGLGQAASEADLIRQLRRQGQYPVSTTPAVHLAVVERVASMLPLRKSLSLRTLASITQELAALLTAGLELDRALGMIAALSGIGGYSEPLARVRQRVRDGATFADSLVQEPAFPAFYVNMVRAGEFGGDLDATLVKLSSYLSRTLAVREAIGSALVYPLILLVTAGFSIIIILTLVLPEFEPLFAESGRALPWPTRLVMGTSDFIRSWGWLLVLIVTAGGLWFWRALTSPQFRLRTDRYALRLPLIGDLLRAMEVERLSRTLGSLLASGVSLPTALRLASDVLWNSILRNAVKESATSLREGESLSARLTRAKVFPQLTLDLIRVGEETGKLDDMLLRQADIDEQRIRHTLDRLLALLVPVLTILLGIVVAGLIASMLVAILSVNDLALQ
jgi:general secretion pathway protein F